jgi:hypothetical protein
MFRLLLNLTMLLIGLVLTKSWSIIEGTVGPILVGSAPVNGTNEVQTLTIDADGGTFKLKWRDRITAAITWSATNNTLIANIQAALTGVKAVQTLTFAGTISGGTFRLRYQNQETDAITWSSTNNTLVANIDAAIEALGNIGTAGVVTAVSTMTSGIGTITVTFAKRRVQPLFEITDVRLTGSGASVAVATTTAGVNGVLPDSAVTVAVGTMTAGVGTATITFDGADYGKQAQPTITVYNNSLTGTATLTVTETTPGVDATARGLLPGGHVIDTTGGVDYINTGTAQAPVYADVQADEA